VPDRGREGVAGQLDRLVVERALIAVLAAGQRGLVELAVVVGAALQRLQRPLLPGFVQVLLEVEELDPEDRERGAGLERLDLAVQAVLDRVVDLARLLAVDRDRAEMVLGPRRPRARAGPRA
jgi:hypothetical protein